MILLALGSNLGDRQAHLEAALAALRSALRLHRVSSVYESAALLPDDAPPEWDIPYYNIVVQAEGDIAPKALLTLAKRIETSLGRKDVGRWGPRVIDIDILAHGDTTLNTDILTLPHPAMTSRDFVMLPLAEIAPHWRLPQGAGKTAHEIVQQQGMVAGLDIRRTTVALHWQTGEGRNG